MYRTLTDQKLLQAGVDTLVNSLNQVQSLQNLVGYLRIQLAQPTSLGLVYSENELEQFIRHAQLANRLSIGFYDNEYNAAVQQSVPNPPPVPPAAAWASTSGCSSEVVNDPAISVYELWSGSGPADMTYRVRGVVREDQSGVDYGYMPATGEVCWFMTRTGAFLSFQTEAICAE